MLITFQSTATPDVLMLRDLAQFLLGIVGKRLDTRGVILRDDLSLAINRLEVAISECKKADAAHEIWQWASHGHQTEHDGGLSQRSWPFLEMLREAHKKNTNIIWGL